MAGEGYRTWVPGEVITADNIQGYLQDQTVQVYPSSAARGSALTGYIAEGMVSYLEDTNAVEVYNGSTWVGLGGDAPIFYTGTSGEFLKSLGTAGVEWDAIPLPANATPSTPGLLPGRATAPTGTAVATAYPSSAFGYEALATATTIGHLAIGAKAGKAISLGSFNTLVGTGSGELIQNGSNNVGVGYRTLRSSVNGSSNTAVGDSALGSMLNGQNNVGVGASAAAISTGSYNTIVGAAAVPFGGTGSNNTVVGGLTIAGSVADLNGNNNIVLGYQAEPSTISVSNQITLGNSSITSLRCNVTSISSLSDERDKTDIEELPVGLDFVKALRPVRFTWDTRPSEPVTLPNGDVLEVAQGRVGVPDMGFIAQDLVAAEDELDAHDWLQLTLRDNPEKLEATQGRLIPILVKAIQELSAEVEALKSQVK
jgi:hypothetical protein